MRSRSGKAFSAACAAGGCFLITSTQDQNATGRQGARVMDQVKFVALDRDDLEVVSTHLQDALVMVADVIWRPQETRLVVGLKSFDWLGPQGTRPEYGRC